MLVQEQLSITNGCDWTSLWSQQIFLPLHQQSFSVPFLSFWRRHLPKSAFQILAAAFLVNVREKFSVEQQSAGSTVAVRRQEIGYRYFVFEFH